jgi:hypothetical protein
MWPVSFLGDWHVGAGDPTFLGWAVTGGYLLTALLCIRADLANRTVSAKLTPSEQWWPLAGFAAALGVNKELDLQTLLIEVVRNAARSES